MWVIRPIHGGHRNIPCDIKIGKTGKKMKKCTRIFKWNPGEAFFSYIFCPSLGPMIKIELHSYTPHTLCTVALQTPFVCVSLAQVHSHARRFESFTFRVILFMLVISKNFKLSKMPFLSHKKDFKNSSLCLV